MIIRYLPHLPRNSQSANRYPTSEDSAEGAGAKMNVGLGNPSYTVAISREQLAHFPKSTSKPPTTPPSNMTYIDVPDHSIVVSIDRGGTFTDVYA